MEELLNTPQPDSISGDGGGGRWRKRRASWSDLLPSSFFLYFYTSLPHISDPGLTTSTASDQRAPPPPPSPRQLQNICIPGPGDAAEEERACDVLYVSRVCECLLLRRVVFDICSRQIWFGGPAGIWGGGSQQWRDAGRTCERGGRGGV